MNDRVLHPDLVDREARVLLEADSWEFHTGREAHLRDCWRYNEFAPRAGWSCASPGGT